MQRFNSSFSRFHFLRWISFIKMQQFPRSLEPINRVPVIPSVIFELKESSKKIGEIVSFVEIRGWDKDVLVAQWIYTQWIIAVCKMQQQPRMINRILRGFLPERWLLSLERRQYQSPSLWFLMEKSRRMLMTRGIFLNNWSVTREKVEIRDDEIFFSYFFINRKTGDL